MIDLLAFAIGALAGTFVEYMGHRLLHVFPSLGHFEHHKRPNDYSVGWMLPAATFSVSAVVALVSVGTSVGILTWYAVYTWLHYRFHHKRFKSSKLQARHDEHHQYGRVNFGVSTTLWDRLFKTGRA